MRLGPHVQIRGNLGSDGRAWAQRASIVLAVDDPEPLRLARPDAFRLFRKFWPQQDIWRHGGEVAALSLAAAGDAPVDGLLLYVECAQTIEEGLARYVDFHKEAEDWLRQNAPNVGLVGYNWSVGKPEQDGIQYVQSKGWGCRWLGMHCYWSGRGGLDEWYAYRYRKVHEWAPNHPPILLTECGRDAVLGDHPGWIAQGISPEGYAQELLAYDTGLPSYVLGGVVFTAGPAGNFLSFDTENISRYMPAGTPIDFKTTPTGGSSMNKAEVAVYSQWSAARLAKGEDPRPLNAFQEHLKALGADYTDPYRFGFPTSPKAP